MELTNLTSTIAPQTEKKNNFKKASAVSNSNNKITNFMITSAQSPSPDRNNSMPNPKPNQVGVFMRKNVLNNSDKKKDVSENSFEHYLKKNR